LPKAKFESECDRLSHVVDDAQFERLRWARVEGPMLARLVELARKALAERSDFELVEEGADRDEKRFVLKVHGSRIATVIIALDGMAATIRVDAAERSKYAVDAGQPVRAEFTAVDADWMAGALTSLFGRIRLLAA
jgi:hypothetical protein